MAKIGTNRQYDKIFIFTSAGTTTFTGTFVLVKLFEAVVFYDAVNGRIVLFSHVYQADLI